jgi:hypothetical protein
MRSIIQILLVALVVAVGGGLLAVAVGKVRESAAGAQCRNNLHQIGITLQTYHDSLGQYPTASMPNPALPPEKRLSWMVGIIPFLEASRFYSKIDKGKGWDAEENRFAALTPCRSYLCPSYPDGPPVSTLIPAHYVGIAGVGPDAASLPRENPRAGFLGWERKLTAEDIRGRGGDLLFVVETGRAHDAWTAAGAPTMRGLEPGGAPYLGTGGQFGGIHPGGANTLRADTSVQFLREDISPEVFEALAVLRGHRE